MLAYVGHLGVSSGEAVFLGPRRHGEYKGKFWRDPGVAAAVMPFVGESELTKTQDSAAVAVAKRTTTAAKSS